MQKALLPPPCPSWEKAGEQLAPTVAAPLATAATFFPKSCVAQRRRDAKMGPQIHYMLRRNITSIINDLILTSRMEKVSNKQRIVGSKQHGKKLKTRHTEDNTATTMNLSTKTTKWGIHREGCTKLLRATPLYPLSSRRSNPAGSRNFLRCLKFLGRRELEAKS